MRGRLDHCISPTRSPPGGGCATRALAALLCREAPARIREMDEWRVGWARRADGRIAQVTAPGHSRPRCCYVDFLNTGPAVAATLRRQVGRVAAIRRRQQPDRHRHRHGRRRGDRRGRARHRDRRPRDDRRQGDDHRHRRADPHLPAQQRLGQHGRRRLCAGARRRAPTLVDMEFVQFFPIGHLAPRLVGMDPIMWDPFRYKLGGRLLDGAGREFLADYGSDETGGYTTPRDIATYAIAQGGRGRARLAAWRRLPVVRRMCRARAGSGVRAGHRAAGAERHRSRPHAGRGVADRALPHGRDRRRRADGEPRARPLRRRRGGGRRQWRQPAVRQRDPRGAGVRRARRPFRRRLCREPRARLAARGRGAGGRANPRLAEGRAARCGAASCSTNCAN